MLLCKYTLVTNMQFHPLTIVKTCMIFASPIFPAMYKDCVHAAMDWIPATPC